MKRKLLLWVGIVTLFLTGSISLLNNARQSVLMMGTSGTVLATGAAFYQEIEYSKVSPIRDFVKVLPVGRHILKPQKYKHFTNYLKSRCELDISDDWGQDQIMRDYWGQPFRITFDKGIDGSCHVEVVSSGWDKEFGEHDVSNIR